MELPRVYRCLANWTCKRLEKLFSVVIEVSTAFDEDGDCSTTALAEIEQLRLQIKHSLVARELQNYDVQSSGKMFEIVCAGRKELHRERTWSFGRSAAPLTYASSMPCKTRRRAAFSLFVSLVWRLYSQKAAHTAASVPTVLPHAAQSDAVISMMTRPMPSYA